MKDLTAFKNISESMIQALENPPNLKEEEEEEDSQFMKELVGAEHGNEMD